MSKIKAIIFDFDGVIAESMDIKAQAFAHLFRDYPEHIQAVLDHHHLHGGLSRFEKFDYIYKNILGLPLTEQRKNELGDQFAKYVYCEVVKCPLVNGAQEVLDKYYQKLKLFVVSGTPQDEMRAIIKDKGLAKYFVAIFGAPERKRELNIKILNKYGLEPQETIFVGDSIDDWEGIQGTGIRFIARITDNKQFKDAEHSIHDLFELETVLNALL